MQTRPRHRDCLRAAADAFRVRFWERLPTASALGIDVGDDHLAMLVPMDDPACRGAAVLRGPEALAEAPLVARSSVPLKELRSDVVLVLAQPRDRVSDRYRAAMDESGIVGELLPHIARHLADGSILPLESQDNAFVVRLMQAIAEIGRDDRLDRWGQRLDGRLRILELSDREGSSVVTIAERPAKPSAAIAVDRAPAPSPEALRGLPRVGACLALDVLDRLPVPVLALSDLENAASLTVFFGRAREHGRRMLWEWLEKGQGQAQPGLPDEVLVGDPGVFEAVREDLAAMGVACRFCPRMPEMEALAQELDVEPTQEEPPGPPAETDEDPAPEPSDLDIDALVKAAHRNNQATERLLEQANPVCTDNEKAWRRYLDVDPPRRRELLRLFDPLVVHSSYLDWFCHSHRAKKRSRTIAQRLADHPQIDPALQEALQARSAAPAGIFRVLELEIDFLVHVVNIATGEPHALCGKPSGLQPVPGTAVPLRVYDLDRMAFATHIGPSIPAAHIEAALDYLRGLGVPIDAPIGMQHWHLLGRLWNWLAERGVTAPGS